MSNEKISMLDSVLFALGNGEEAVVLHGSGKNQCCFKLSCNSKLS